MNYNYSSYCQRPDEIDLSVYQFPPSARNSAVTSPVAREQQFLNELRNLRAGYGFDDGSHQARDVPIRFEPSYTRQPSPMSLHRTFSDSNVVSPYRNGREDPHWMTNPPPPFASSRYNSLDRSRNNSGQQEKPMFFKCASPTPWQSVENVSNVERIPKQRFFSPGPETTRREPARMENRMEQPTRQDFVQHSRQEPWEEDRTATWNSNGMSTSYPTRNDEPKTDNWELNGYHNPSYTKQNLFRQSEPPQRIPDPVSRVPERHVQPVQPDWRPGGFFSTNQHNSSNGFIGQNIAQSQDGSFGRSLLDRAMQNRETRNSAIISPELEMDMVITHSSYRGGPPQRHSYAGSFSEFSRAPHQLPRLSEGVRDSWRPVPRNEPEPSSSVSSPGLEMNISSTSHTPMRPERSLPTSPVVNNNNPLRPMNYNDPLWELDSIYGMSNARDSQAYPSQSSSLFRNEAQRPTVTTPMYGRGTLNERQVADRASTVSPVTWERRVEQQPRVMKHTTGILLNPNETRRTNKRVMFVCDADENRGVSGSLMVSSPESADAPPHVKTYDASMEDVLARFLGLSEQIGGDVATQAKKLQNVFDTHRQFLWQAASQAKPSADGLQKLFQPILKLHEEMIAFKDSKRTSAQFNHLNAIVEGTPALAWVTIEKTPAPYIKETLDAAMFYLNRILKEYKDKDQKHVDWVKTYKELIETLHTFVRQTHTTGLVWNSAPGNVPQGVAAAKPSAPGPSGGAAPPPPPPPPSNLMADISKASAPSGDQDGRAALFAALNKGEGITSGLKKVTSDMQTHKNPALRGQATVPSHVGAGATSSSTPARAAPVQRTPVIELKDCKQWNVEFHNGNRNIVVEIQDKKQSVYVYKCENSVIQVKGKCNSVALDSCKKTSIVFDALVAQCETINCQSIQIQTLGEMPTLSIQKTDGCQVYLSEPAKNCEIVTSKSSEMNILVPEGADGDFVELPVPEQFKTVYRGGKLVTTASDII